MVSNLKNKSVQEAPFRVLKLPDIPAVLIETAYISNPQEEILLKKSGFQKSLALAISSSISEYLSDTAAVAQSKDALKNDDETDMATENKMIMRKPQPITKLNAATRFFQLRGILIQKSLCF